MAHCPNSNFSLKSGVCDVRRLQAAGVKVGLGTDCSGGYSVSLLNAMRLAVLASNCTTAMAQEEEGEEEKVAGPLDFTDALHLATRGGASLLGMEASLGSLEPQKLADLLVVDMFGHQTTVPFGHENVDDLVHKFVFLGDERNVVQVFVNGRAVKDITNNNNREKEF